MSVDIMERLRAMAGDPPVAKSKPKAESKTEPKVRLAETADIAAVADQPRKHDGAVPVVVLEDGTTFSALNGCRICFVSEDAEEIDRGDYNCGIPISDLYALYSALKNVVG